MRTNKAILDEAARSVRRTFIVSIVGSVGMLGVVGAAGAYGMPDRLTAQALSAALTTLNVRLSPMLDRAGPIVGRAMMLASEMKSRAQDDGSVVLPVPHAEVAALSPAAVAAWQPVQTVEPEPVASVVPPAAAEAAPFRKPETVMPMVEPAETPVAVMPAVAPVEPVAAPVIAPAAPVVASEPPSAIASVAPAPQPEAALERAYTVPASLVFEAPDLSKIKPLTALPKIEAIIATPEAAKPQPVAPAAAAAPSPEPVAVELPRGPDLPHNVWAHLIAPKPPLSPAQRLELHGKAYDQAEHCLAQAVYFEARNEPVRGQQAVAQVVLNRVFSPYYPKDVCSVVFQNAHRHLSCQFTFACDGKSEAIRERGAWARAARIAKQTLDAKIWLPEVAKATHYHAAYVHPNWVRDMRVMVRYGLHTFYRPRNWGDGSNEPSWGSSANALKKGRAS